MSTTRKKQPKDVTTASSEAPTPKAKKASVPRPDEMSPEVIEFITAIDEYKRLYQRPFPSWSEVLDIVKELGYEKAG